MSTEMDTEVLKVLESTRKLIEAGWCQGVGALGPGGRAVSFRDPKARKFCLVGAVARSSSSLPSEDLLWVKGEVYASLYLAVPPHYRAQWATESLITFNDDPQTSQEDVLKVIDRAIARKKEGRPINETQA